MIESPPLRFTIEEAEAAAAWRFNCGPAALCAVLGKTPREIRPHLLDFEAKGYTNPSLMAAILRGLGVPFQRRFERLGPVEGHVGWPFPSLGLVRIQWAGPWTKPGVPMRARYRHTHWIGIRERSVGRHRHCCREAFDINAMGVGGWMPYDEWAGRLVPWLIRKCVPNASGDWWPTHVWKIPVE